MRFISEIKLTGIVKNYVENFKKRTERENKNTLFSTLDWVEVPYLERIKELEEENAKLKQQNAKMRCCANCKKERNKPEPLAVHTSCMKCKNHSEWEMAE